ncbi:Methylated-DNA--protein-cysteine methyltransferase OS=Streptomyces tendae OX=1932 GN=GUR47_31210 PE=3 SV=1 [Streptomyces tendae]
MTTMTYWYEVDSSVGRLLLTAAPDGALTSLSVPGQKGGRSVQDGWRHDAGPFRTAEEQLGAYFAGELTRFRLPLRAEGTPFRERVWAALDEVPYGVTTTYGEIAARIGASRPGGARGRRRDRRRPVADPGGLQRVIGVAARRAPAAAPGRVRRPRRPTPAPGTPPRACPPAPALPASGVAPPREP